jgi:hypothetical protein
MDLSWALKKIKTASFRNSTVSSNSTYDRRLICATTFIRDKNTRPKTIGFNKIKIADVCANPASYQSILSL